ncbi:MAG: LamG domain-containing protein [bacterium]|nr:LamG domain-containing protein [bacterium]
MDRALRKSRLDASLRLPLTAIVCAWFMSGPAQAQLLHRYSFDGSGTVLVDSVGGADGTVLGGATLGGTGTLIFDGVDDYVELPPNLLTGLVDATFEAWVDWGGGVAWQRIFDFGDSSGGPGNQGNGLTYIVLTPEDGTNAVPTGAVLAGGTTSIKVYANSATATATMVHYAFVFDGANDSMSLYVDGIFQSSTPITMDLSGINDVNNWLGRSQWSANPNFGGTMTEFRLYGEVLDASAVAGSYAAGPGGAGSVVGTSYCGPAIPNSSGLAGAITAEGSSAVLLNDLTLVADQLPPGQFAFFLSSQTQGFVNPPGSSGILCLGGGLGPFHQQSQIFQGPSGTLAVDLTSIPVNPVQAVLPGDTWNFQCWYRDIGNTNNLTDAVSVAFQ